MVYGLNGTSGAPPLGDGAHSGPVRYFMSTTRCVRVNVGVDSRAK